MSDDFDDIDLGDVIDGEIMEGDVPTPEWPDLEGLVPEDEWLEEMILRTKMVPIICTVCKCEKYITYLSNVIMEIYISFEEMAMIAEEKMGQKLRFERIDAYSFKVSKQVSIPVFKIKKWVGLGVEVVGFEVMESGEHELKFKAASDIVSWLVGHANGTTISEYADINGRELAVHLDKIEKLKEALEYVEPKSLNFSEEGAVLSVEIKSLTADIQE